MEEMEELEEVKDVPAQQEQPEAQDLPPMPEAKDVSALLPDSMGLDILRQNKIVPLRIEDDILIVG
ncbi:MAG: type II secretion system protein GspE, partial [Synergistaceae bacterium]|nr:type II secretion system protein GspE [Synergistaceae bacterium]